MKQALKQLFAGFIFSLMSMSFILSPIPRVNVALAEEGVYRPGGDFEDTIKQAHFNRYTEHQDSLVAIIEQAVSGMMALALIKSIRYNYLHEIMGKEGALYGNDCVPNKAAKYSMRIASLGSLAYLMGDIRANKKFVKAAEKAAKKNFTPANGQSALEKDDEERKNKQIEAFDTLIEVFERQKDGVDAKKNALTFSQLGFAAALGIEGINGLQCAAACVTNRTAMKARLALFYGAAEAAAAAITGESVINQACSSSLAALGGLVTLATAKEGINETQDNAIAVAENVEREAEEKVWYGFLLSIGAMIKQSFADAKNYMSKASVAGADQAASELISAPQLEQAKKILTIPVEIKDDAKASAILGTQGAKVAAQVAKDGTSITALATAGQGCSVGRIPLSFAISSFINYFYTPVQCCGGPAHSKVAQKEILAGKQSLAAIADTLAGGATADTARAAAMELAKNKLVEVGIEKAGDKALQSAMSSIDPTGGLIDALIDSAAVETDLDLLKGTMPGFGLPAVPAFWSKKDIRMLGLLEGWFSSAEQREIKYFVKKNFESILRRFALQKQLETFDVKNPESELNKVAELEQKINHVMFFYSQIVDDLAPSELANAGFKKHELWPTVLGTISNILMPEAHAGFISGMLGGIAGKAALKVVVKALGLKGGTWEAILNVGPQFMMMNAVLGKIGKSWAFVSPRGRTVTWMTMNAVNLVVKSLDEKAEDKIKKNIEAVRKEKDRYVSGAWGNTVAEKSSNNGNLRARSARARGDLSFGSGEGFEDCAVANGSGFSPVPCSADIPSSGFDMPEGSQEALQGLPPAYGAGVGLTSQYSQALATGAMGADELAAMDMGPIETAHQAMRKHNEKLLKKIDEQQKKAFKGSKMKAPAALSQMLAKAKKHLFTETGRQTLASLPPASSAEDKDDKETKDDAPVVTKSTPFDFNFSPPKSKKTESLDFSFGDEGGVVSEEERDVAKAEEDLGDFVLQHDDINKRKDVSIFKILSNRYLLSYPKVLEEKKPQDN